MLIINNLIRKRFGLLVLIVVLTVISAGMIKPGFYLLGWDNFSSYLNLKDNIFNTFFATWRDYRGLGAASDGEVNDIFRQVFSFAASLVFKMELVDQLYMTVMLWGGVLGMYGLGKKISRGKELFGFLAAFFYLFNLSTLAVFYFPMIMYNSRFFMLPTMVYVLLELTERQQISWKKYLLYLLILFVGFGSFMVPTIFVVMVMFLGLLALLKRSKRVLVVLIFYVLLGSYWMLPFANYVKQKAGIVPEAPTFREVDDIRLNKSGVYFSFERQAKLEPNFFEPEFTNRATDQKQFFHLIVEKVETGVEGLILWIFPILYLGGAGYVLMYKRKKRILRWFAVGTVVFLLLSMYGWHFNNIPLLSTVFRFGDTKFHAMVAFSGAIMAAVLLTELVRLRKLLAGLVIGLVVVAHLWVFQSYFNGNFIGFFMYNKIPDAYFEMAKIINEDDEQVRVVHLPMDSHAYWKPYRWGYFGSSFFNFMINKPLFDRSFEPASMENAEVHGQLKDLLHMAGSVSESELLEKRAGELYKLLGSLSVKYIIDDQTISPFIDSRQIEYWGKINVVDSRRLLNYMRQKGYLDLEREYWVNPQKYIEDYAKLYPYNQGSGQAREYKINLYKLADFEQTRVELLSQINEVHFEREWQLDEVEFKDSEYSYVWDLKNDEMVLRSDESCEGSGQILKSENGVKSLVSNCRNFIQKGIKFSSDNYYFWQVKYKHISGSTPTIILTGKLDEYFYQKLYLEKGKTGVSGFIVPRFDLKDYGDKQLIIQHHSENVGEIELEQVALVEVPVEWVNSKIAQDNSGGEKFDTRGEVVDYKKVLPSLWKVEIEADKGELLLKFGNGFDRQWRLIGADTIYHTQCDKYFNCYKIKSDGGSLSLYLFYVPELLSVFGWVLTGWVIIKGGMLLGFRRRTP